jgi:hypothetical protein
MRLPNGSASLCTGEAEPNEQAASSSYLLTYNLASLSGPNSGPENPIDVKSDEAIQI